jgi:hypothetical protein
VKIEDTGNQPKVVLISQLMGYFYLVGLIQVRWTFFPMSLKTGFISRDHSSFKLL